jgi:hypothetical protein
MPLSNDPANFSKLFSLLFREAPEGLTYPNFRYPVISAALDSIPLFPHWSTGFKIILLLRFVDKRSNREDIAPSRILASKSPSQAGQ